MVMGMLSLLDSSGADLALELGLLASCWMLILILVRCLSSTDFITTF